MGKDIHKFIVPEGSHWNDVRNTTENIGIAIKNAFYELEQKNEDSKTHEKILLGVFGDAPWANKAVLPDETLKNLIEHKLLDFRDEMWYLFVLQGGGTNAENYC